MYLITIDGPAASGKSTVAKLVAQKLNIVHINSGEAYRAISYFMISSGISPTDKASVIRAINENNFDMKYIDGKQILLVNGNDITQYLHTNQVNAVVSQYSTIPEVIYAACDMARCVCKDLSVVMEGRNIGSFCFPEAKYKFYVDCDVKERAIRRYNEMLQKGINVDFDEIYQQTIERDTLDKTRDVAPLKVPVGAVMLDSTNLTPEQVANQISQIVKDNEH